MVWTMYYSVYVPTRFRLKNMKALFITLVSNEHNYFTAKRYGKWLIYSHTTIDQLYSKRKIKTKTFTGSFVYSGKRIIDLFYPSKLQQTDDICGIKNQNWPRKKALQKIKCRTAEMKKIELQLEGKRKGWKLSFIIEFIINSFLNR